MTIMLALRNFSCSVFRHTIGCSRTSPWAMQVNLARMISRRVCYHKDLSCEETFPTFRSKFGVSIENHQNWRLPKSFRISRNLWAATFVFSKSPCPMCLSGKIKRLILRSVKTQNSFGNTEKVLKLVSQILITLINAILHERQKSF